MVKSILMSQLSEGWLLYARKRNITINGLKLSGIARTKKNRLVRSVFFRLWCKLVSLAGWETLYN
ncbi:hypothetical protein A3N51_08995 [Enterobacter kobei]|nr:hypothetical protein A3N51_08995 [Enterobacter kobei]